MAGRLPGPICFLNIGSALDVGTLNQQRNTASGPMSGNGVGYYSILGPILVGKPLRDPGKNEDGTVYEDMLNDDAPPKSAAIKSEFFFNAPDAKLEELGRDLMNSVSTGELNKVALECWDRFCRGTGGTYTSSKLYDAVRENGDTQKFVNDFAKTLRQAILDCKCDLSQFKPLQIDHYAFNSFLDKATGLGIIVHDWWSIKAEITRYSGTWDHVAQKGAFYCDLVFTMTDDFGLDWKDILQHGEDILPPNTGFFKTGHRFKAWYILQHYRKNHKPFFVEVQLKYDFDDTASPLK